jgi:hypothetical protein
MKLKFELYQVNAENRRGFAFEGLDFLKIVGETVKLERYDKVYAGERGYVTTPQFLEDLYTEFNMNHTKDFTGRSMSVSDLVSVNGNYFFCDSYGWKEVNPK